MALIYYVDVLYYVRNLLLQFFSLFSEPANKSAMAFKQCVDFCITSQTFFNVFFLLQSQFIEKGFKETENVEHSVLLLLF